MFAFRTAIARAVPSMAMRVATLPRTVVAPTMLTRAGSVSAFRSFSNTPLARNQMDEELISMLQNEIKHEEDQGEVVPEVIASYLKTSPFTIMDKPGSDEVALTRKFGNEDIKIVFSVSDISAADDEADFEEDLEDDDQPPANQSLSASGVDAEDAGDEIPDSLDFP
ncbi:Mitochondrial acidic protein mam33, partial [Modicella reniformis]